MSALCCGIKALLILLPLLSLSLWLLPCGVAANKKGQKSCSISGALHNATCEVLSVNGRRCFCLHYEPSDESAHKMWNVTFSNGKIFVASMPISLYARGCAQLTLFTRHKPSSAAQPNWAIDSSAKFSLFMEWPWKYISILGILRSVQFVSGFFPKVSLFLHLSVCLFVCLLVCLFVCFDLFHLKMMQFVAINDSLSTSTTWGNLTAYNGARAMRFPCLNTLYTHSQLVISACLYVWLAAIFI